MRIGNFASALVCDRAWSWRWPWRRSHARWVRASLLIWVESGVVLPAAGARAESITGIIIGTPASSSPAGHGSLTMATIAGAGHRRRGGHVGFGSVTTTK